MTRSTTGATRRRLTPTMVLAMVAALLAVGVPEAGAQVAVDPCGPDGPAPTIEGSDSSDRLLGTPGNDVIHGYGGSDAIFPSGGADIVCGGPGRDKVVYRNESARVVVDLVAGTGRRGSVVDEIHDVEMVQGTRFDDVLIGDAADNTIEGLAGNDRMFGGPGRDYMLGAAGNDTVRGEAGADSLVGDAGTNTLDGGPDDDRLWYDGFGNGTANGGTGNDSIGTTSGGAIRIDLTARSAGFLGAEALYSLVAIEDIDVAGIGDHMVLIGNSGPNSIFSGYGDPHTIIDGRGGSDEIFVWYSNGAAEVMGGEGNDRIFLDNVPLYNGPGSPTNVVLAGPGHDEVYGSNGDDTISGGTGDDTLYGDGADDTVNGGPGTDACDGGWQRVIDIARACETLTDFP